MASFIKSDTHLTLVFADGDSATVYNSDNNYAAVCAAVKNKDWEAAKVLASPAVAIKQSFKDVDKIAIEGGFVTYDNIPLHSTLSDRMLDMHNNGFDILPMALFLENLMQNPSYRAVNELYDFLEASDLPITEDGHFLAYKRVSGEFKDIYTGKIDHSPETVVEMPRNRVNEDKNRTCSDGLHFCSHEYLPYYGSSGMSNKIVMVKINPADVVSIPSDYNNAKGRCCKYYVVKELETDDIGGHLPKENLEGSYRDIRTPITADSVEQISLTAFEPNSYQPIVLACFASADEAMNNTGVDSILITSTCNRLRGNAGGFGWRWATDNPNNYIEDSESIEDSETPDFDREEDRDDRWEQY